MAAHHLTTLGHPDSWNPQRRTITIHGAAISQSMAQLAQFNTNTGSKITFAHQV